LMAHGSCDLALLEIDEVALLATCVRPSVIVRRLSS